MSLVKKCLVVAALIAALSAWRSEAIWGADGNVPVKKTSAQKGRRLPPHYANVVNEEQREKIFKIQEEYLPQIEMLELQLKTVKKDWKTLCAPAPLLKAVQENLNATKKERDEKIAAVLTPEQKKKIAEAVAKAKHKPGQ